MLNRDLKSKNLVNKRKELNFFSLTVAVFKKITVKNILSQGKLFEWIGIFLTLGIPGSGIRRKCKTKSLFLFRTFFGEKVPIRRNFVFFIALNEVRIGRKCE